MFLSRDPRRGARRSASGPAIRSRPHIVRAFDDDLAAVGADTARLGGAAEDLVSEALRALAPGAPDLAAEAAARRDRLAADARRLTERAAVVLARRQPLAADLRQVLGALRLAGALGRIGDLAANVAARAPALGRRDGGLPDDLDAAPGRLGSRALLQLSEALSAHQEGDAARARAVWRRDGELDAHYDSLFGSLIAAMAQRPEEVARGAQRLFVAKNLERVGDQARRVAAAAYWTATGEEVDADC